MKKALISLVLIGTSFLGNSIAEERKFYLTGSGGIGWLRDQDVDIDAAYQNDFGTKVIDYFDPDLNFEIGIGYYLG